MSDLESAIFGNSNSDKAQVKRVLKQIQLIEIIQRLNYNGPIYESQEKPH